MSQIAQMDWLCVRGFSPTPQPPPSKEGEFWFFEKQ